MCALSWSRQNAETAVQMQSSYSTSRRRLQKDMVQHEPVVNPHGRLMVGSFLFSGFVNQDVGVRASHCGMVRRCPVRGYRDKLFQFDATTVNPPKSVYDLTADLQYQAEDRLK